jgi:hypothetical protein
VGCPLQPDLVNTSCSESCAPDAVRACGRAVHLTHELAEMPFRSSPTFPPGGLSIRNQSREQPTSSSIRQCTRSSLLVSDTSDPTDRLAQEAEENAGTFSSVLCQPSATLAQVRWLQAVSSRHLRLTAAARVKTLRASTRVFRQLLIRSGEIRSPERWFPTDRADLAFRLPLGVEIKREAGYPRPG